MRAPTPPVLSLSASLLALATALTVPILLLPTQAHAADQFCGSLAAPATIVDSNQRERVADDGSKIWSSTVSYTLSTGETAEAWLTFDSHEAGEIHIAVDGVIVAFVSYAVAREPAAALGQGHTTRTWIAPELGDDPALVAELLQESVGELLLAGVVPEAMQCSDFGKGVVRGLKYLWIGVTAAAAAGCCAGTGSLGCAACAAGAAAAGTAGVDAANNHCD